MSRGGKSLFYQFLMLTEICLLKFRVPYCTKSTLIRKVAAKRRLKVLFFWRIGIDRKFTVELKTVSGFVVAVVSLNTYAKCLVAKILSRFHRPRFRSGPRRESLNGETKTDAHLEEATVNAQKRESDGSDAAEHGDGKREEKPRRKVLQRLAAGKGRAAARRWQSSLFMRQEKL